MFRTLRKAGLLMRLLPLHPREFLDRVGMRLDMALGDFGRRGPSLSPEPVEEVLGLAADCLGRDVVPFCDESALNEIEGEAADRVASLAGRLPFSLAHSADKDLARLCYVMCRVLRPRAVVETGVAYGMTSAYILQALHVNGCGRLWSVDLPPLASDADRHVGVAVPDSLRERWCRRRGMSRRLLPQVLSEAGPVGVFVHDSLHTYRNIRWELATVTPHIERPAVVIVDDVEHHAAFEDWAASVEPAAVGVVQESHKPDAFGVGVFR